MDFGSSKFYTHANLIPKTLKPLIKSFSLINSFTYTDIFVFKGKLSRFNLPKMNLVKKMTSYGLGMLSIMALPSFAGQMGGPESPVSHPWFVAGSIGYTDYQEMYRSDGETILGRLAIGREFYTTHLLIWGLELGVQNGNTMRFFPSQEAVDTLGGLPMQTTVKPMLDGLVSLKTGSFGAGLPVYGILKGGIAYRRWQFNDRDSINDKSQVAGEVQAGLGCLISERASLSVLYQGIFDSNPDFTLDTLNNGGHVSNIPIQNGVLLSLTVNV